MNKKIKALLLAVVMVVAVVLGNFPQVRASEMKHGLSISTRELHPGTRFTVSATIPPLKGLCATMNGKVAFDSSAFELVEYKVPEIEKTDGDQSDDMELANKNGFFSYLVYSKDDGFPLPDGYCVTATFVVKDGVKGLHEFNIIDLEAYDDDGNVMHEITTEKTLSVNVTIPATKISVSKTTLTLKANTTESLSANVTPANTTDTVSWKSGDEKIATVDENGKVTAVSVGKTTITATAGAYSATCEVTVTCAHAKITKHDAVPSTCTEQGHAAYTYCEDCKTVVEGSDEALPLEKHKLTHTKRVEAKCETDGNIEYWQCSVCKKYFRDSDAKTEIKQEDTVLTETGHTDSKKWETNADKHWKPCNSCGNSYKFDEGKHTYPEKKAYDDKEHWDACSVCEYVKNKKAHTGGKATCKELAICTECGQAYGKFADHNYVEKADAKYLKTAATCTEKAVYYKSCSVCGLAHTSETFTAGTVDAKNHAGGTELKNVKEAKCYETGYTGDTYCKGCNAKIADGKVIDKIPHKITSWKVTEEPTTEKTGKKTGHCENKGCTEEHQVTIAKLVSTGETVASVSKDENVKVKSVTISKDSNVTGNVVLQVGDVTKTLTESELKEIEKHAKGKEGITESHKTALVLDIKMILSETTDNGDAIADEKFDLQGEVEIKLQLSKTLAEKYENLVLLHIKDDGSVEVIPFVMDENGVVIFKATDFSYYTFSGVEKQPASNENVADTKKDDTSSVPKSGDHQVVWAWVFLAVCSGAVMLIFIVKKQKRMF